MIPLFGDAEADGTRDVLEGRMPWLSLEAVKVSTNGVVDYGCWSQDEQSAIRRLVEAEDARFRMVYLPEDHAIQRARIAYRWTTTPEATLPMSDADIQHGRAHFEEPDTAELEGLRPASPPARWRAWREWAADRWPSFA